MTATDLWYRPSDMPPPFNVRVRVQWAGRTFEAARLWLKRKKKAAWGAVKPGGGYELLPPKKGRKHWSTEPDLYQPLHPDRWKVPLPVPVALTGAPDPRFEPGHKPPAEPQEPVEAPGWWRHEAPTYSPPGAISEREAEARVMRALMTNRALRNDEPSGFRGGSNSDWIAKMIDKTELELGLRERASYWHSRFTPTARDCSDYLVAFEWMRCANLSNNERTTLQMRAADPAFSWTQIGKARGMSCTRENARRLYSQAIRKIAKGANAGW